MANNVNQIYTLVNSVAKQALGTTAVTVTDLQSLVSLGNDVLSTSTSTDAFTGVLTQRIAKTIFATRPYASKLSRIFRRDQTTWGQAIQKISVKMIDAETDDSVTLTNGVSVDMYKVNKPTVLQKIFATQEAYQWHVTIQRKWLQNAFTSPENMENFIGSVMTAMNNSINFSEDNLFRMTVVNYLAEINGTAREINLLEGYNTAFGQQLTVATALNDPNFLAYAVKTISTYVKRFTEFSTMYNDGTVERHTPKDKEVLLLSVDFTASLEAYKLADTYNTQFLTLRNYEEISYWQGQQTPMSVNVNRASDGTAKTIGNVIGCLADWEALGYFRHDQRTSVTPFNSAGEYTNYFTKCNDQYFNDLSENFVSFIISD